jgi:hypothetical protein
MVARLATVPLGDDHVYVVAFPPESAVVAVLQIVLLVAPAVTTGNGITLRVTATVFWQPVAAVVPLKTYVVVDAGLSETTDEVEALLQL